MLSAKNLRKSTLPPPLRKARLCAEDLHLLTAIPFGALENFIAGQFKPAPHDREILTYFGRQIDGRTLSYTRSLIQRAKYRLLTPFISAEEKAEIFSHGMNGYEKSLDLLIQKYQPAIEQVLAERYEAKSA